MTFNWAMPVIVIIGLALALSPWIAKLWVDAETRCPMCGRELLLFGSSMMHRSKDLEFCRFLIERGYRG